MAGYGSFAAQLQGFKEDAERKIHKVVAASILEFGDRVVMRSPVDVGFFKNSWVLTEGSPSTEAAAGTGYVLTIPPDPAGRLFYFTNNTKYGMRLEFGFVGQDSLGRTYNQAPRGFVRKTAMEWESIVDAEAAKVA
jgi:hypothetical protein